MFFLQRLGKKDIFIDIPESEFKSIIFHVIKNSSLSRKKDIFEGIIAREKLKTTAMGNAIAIPHCRLDNFKGIYVKFVLFKGNLGYIAPNNEEVRFIFLIAGSREDMGYYVRTLAHIAKIMKSGTIRKELLQARNKKEICRVFREYENKELEKVLSWK
ncbi:PTS sugar transporter subunit IIA [Candidatus Omnitrophota bacterium]